MSPSTDKTGRYYGIPKGKKVTVFDKVMNNSKKLPGVGKYESALALDKVYRPMKSMKNS
jgi:hypothetical protein